MPHYVTVATVDEIPPGAREVVEVEGIYIAVFNIGGTLYAIEDVCTHDDGPLVEGDLDGYEVTCLRHGARFDVRTGKALSMPAVVDVPWFPVRIEGNEIQVDIAEDAD